MSLFESNLILKHVFKLLECNYKTYNTDQKVTQDLQNVSFPNKEYSEGTTHCVLASLSSLLLDGRNTVGDFRPLLKEFQYDA